MNTKITNERYDMLHKKSDEGNIEIANERHDVLQKNLMKEEHQSHNILKRWKKWKWATIIQQMIVTVMICSKIIHQNNRNALENQ